MVTVMKQNQNASTENSTAQLCQIYPSAVRGSGYIAGRKYEWTACTTGFVEITDPVTGRVTHESNACFARRFTRL